MNETTKTIEIDAPVSDVYRLWAEFENFPRFMEHIQDVRKTGDRTSHWVMSGPAGRELEWDAETVEMVPNQRISWASISGDVVTRGSAVFESLDASRTRVSVTMEYSSSGGGLYDWIGRLLGRPESRLETDLENFKKFAEQEYSRR